MSSSNMRTIVDAGTQQPIGEAPELDATAVEAMITRARTAQPQWAQLGFIARARALRRFSSLIVRDPALPKLITAESGKPLFESEHIEVLYTAELIRHLTGRAGRRALREEYRTPFFFPNKRTHLIRQPRGVVGIVGPFNWPLLNHFADAVGPLLAGNAVVIKPSPLTPLTSLHIKKMWDDSGFPPDVLQIATGGNTVGEALTRGVDLIFLTGSPTAGRAVAKLAAERLIPAIVELGGKNPAIVLDDADVDSAAHTIVWGAFLNTGQACVHIEQLFVVNAVADRMVAALATEVKKLRQGASANTSDFEQGFLTRPGQAQYLRTLVDEAVAQGATVVARGPVSVDGPNSFPAMVLDHVRNEMRVASEELFGPILVITRVKDEEEALLRANALPGGITASVYSADRSRARALARRIETGSVCINDTIVHYFAVESPLGGVKGSGLGHRHGAESMLQFTRTEVIIEDRPGLGAISRLIRGQLGYPYRSHIARILRWLRLRLYG
ncbi:MAG: aldehyde dehydrogenase family protein [Deltaproteobacteria bacterium]|nr:aldehyde dehydrogenase family protein [Deltaproteobacteria bacterium]